MSRTVAVVRVPFVYGGFLWVAAADLADERKALLPLYTRTGERFTDTRKGMLAEARGEAMHLHRENIGPKQSEADALRQVERIFAAAGQ